METHAFGFRLRANAPEGQKRFTIMMLYGVFLTAAKTTAVVMFLVAAALVSAWPATRANIPSEMA